MIHQLILFISLLSLVLVNPIFIISIVGFFAFENVMNLILNSINLWMAVSLAIPLLGSFCLAYFTIQYTQYLQRKGDFNSAMIWLFTEGSLLTSSLDPVKRTLEEVIARIDAQTQSKNIDQIFFPDIMLNSLDYIVSKGFFALFTEDYMKKMIKLKSDVSLLKYHCDSYYQLKFMAPNVTIENFNQQKRVELTSMCDCIDQITRDWKAHQMISYPRTFLQWLLLKF
jgi:hypothetical protein